MKIGNEIISKKFKNASALERPVGDISLSESFLNYLKVNNLTLSKFLRNVSEDNDGEQQHETFNYLPESYFSDVFKNGKRVQTGIIRDFVIDDLIDMFGDCPLTELVKRAIMYELSKKSFALLGDDGKKILSPPFSSNGSKTTMYKCLLQHIIMQLNITTINEPFGRTAALSMCIDKGIERIYNDADPLFTNYNRCLRNDVGKLITAIETLYKHMNELASPTDDGVKRVKEFHKKCRQECIAFYEQTCKDKELKLKRDSDKHSKESDFIIAAKLFVVVNMAYGGDFNRELKQNFKKSIESGKPLKFNAEKLRICSYRIQNMSIACGDFGKAIKQNNVSEQMLTFVDPPYLPKKNKNGKLEKIIVIPR